MAYPVCCQCKKPMPEEFWECEDDELQIVDSSSSCREPIPMSTVLLQIVKSSTGRANLSQTNRIGIQESAEALQIPYLFSTVRLLAEVQRIHDEEFNNHKALQVADAMGVSLQLMEASRRDQKKRIHRHMYTGLHEPPFYGGLSPQAPRRET